VTPAGLWVPTNGPRTFGPPQPWPEALRALCLARRAMGGDWRLEQVRQARKVS
jgi:hypothetical protein